MSAYDYLEILEKHFVNPSRMGCVMLDVKPLPINEWLDPEQQALYGATDPAKPWVTGFQTNEQHITLKYGLMTNANLIKDDVNALLAGIEFIDLYVGHTEVFDQDGDYSCIVGRVYTDREDSLALANERLSYLPHIDTFPDYKPHVTIAYVHDKFVDTVLEQLDIFDTNLEPIGLNYGYEPGPR